MFVQVDVAEVRCQGEAQQGQERPQPRRRGQRQAEKYLLYHVHAFILPARRPKYASAAIRISHCSS